jgi:hypothetical protein
MSRGKRLYEVGEDEDVKECKKVRNSAVIEEDSIKIHANDSQEASITYQFAHSLLVKNISTVENRWFSFFPEKYPDNLSKNVFSFLETLYKTPVHFSIKSDRIMLFKNNDELCIPLSVLSEGERMFVEICKRNPAKLFNSCVRTEEGCMNYEQFAFDSIIEPLLDRYKIITHFAYRLLLVSIDPLSDDYKPFLAIKHILCGAFVAILRTLMDKKPRDEAERLKIKEDIGFTVDIGTMLQKPAYQRMKVWKQNLNSHT